MNAVAPRAAEMAAIRTQLGAIFVSLELSRPTWLVTSLSPGGGEKMSKHLVRAGDVAGLLERFSSFTERGIAHLITFARRLTLGSRFAAVRAVSRGDRH